MSTAGIKRVNQGYGHGYWIDGKRATGVTTALKALPKDLSRWGARTVAEYVVANPAEVTAMIRNRGQVPALDFMVALPKQALRNASTRGTKVHKLAERVVTGEEVEVPVELEGYVASYIRFLDEFGGVEVASELVVANRTHNYAGTLDSIQDIPGIGRVLVDYKTSNGIYGETALQVAAYRNAEVYLDGDGNEQPMIPVEHTYVLHIQSDGYAFYPLLDTDGTAFDAFLSALDTYRRCIQEVRGTKRIEAFIGLPVEPPTRSAA